MGAIGNDGTDTNAGHVRVCLVGRLVDAARLDVDGKAGYDQSGWSVALSADGTILAVGAKTSDGTGTDADVRVHKWSEGKWTQLGVDIDGEAADDNGKLGRAERGTILSRWEQ